MSPVTEPHPRAVRFAFRAVDPAGATALGELWAPSEDAARHQLALRRLLPLALTRAGIPAPRRRTPAASDLSVGLRVLASLLEAQLPVGRALSVFRSTAPNGWSSEMIAEIEDAVREGVPLTQALARAVPGIPAHALAMVEATEATGSIADGCRLAALELESAAAAASALRAALAYPTTLALSGLVATGVLVGIVLPRFAELLDQIGQPLPATTRVLLATAAVIRLAALPTVVGVLVLGATFAAWRRTVPRAERAVAAMLLRIPPFGDLLLAAAGARVVGTLSGLLGAGVPLPAALAHAAAAAGNAAVSHRVTEAATRVLAGERLSRALDLASALSPRLVQLTRAGEESGDLVGLLRFGATLERGRMQERLSGLIRLLEPALILAFGALIALVAGALLQALYSVRPA